MKFGFVVPTGSVDQILTMAHELEAHDWDGFFHWDGIAPGDSEFWEDATDNTGAMSVFDPWSVLSAVAVQTSRLTLGAMIFPLSRRRPWVVARQALTIDHLSNGRLVLPVGLGAVDEAGFAKVHPEVTDRKARAERLDESLDILAKAATGRTFTHTGTHYQLDAVTFAPPTVQQPHIPVWTVGSWPRPKSLARAARWDGIIPSISNDPFRRPTPEEITAIRDWVAEHRESMDGYDVVIEGVSPANDPEWVDAELRPLADAGTTWWIESRWEAPNDVDTLLERIRQGPPKLSFS